MSIKELIKDALRKELRDVIHDAVKELVAEEVSAELRGGEPTVDKLPTPPKGAVVPTVVYKSQYKLCAYCGAGFKTLHGLNTHIQLGHHKKASWYKMTPEQRRVHFEKMRGLNPKLKSPKIFNVGD